MTMPKGNVEICCWNSMPRPSEVKPRQSAKHGKPAAVVVPMEEAKRLYPGQRLSFAVETERDTSRLREADL